MHKNPEDLKQNWMVWQNKLDSELHQDFFLSLFCVGAVLWVI
jgi:hypothetical protein